MKLTHSMKSQARKLFDGWAISYDQSFLNGFLFLPSYQVLLEELYAWRGSGGEPLELLDVGCGTGTFDAMLAASPIRARVVGLDYTPAMCKVAVAKAGRAKLADRLRHVAADSEHLPFADASFGAVTCSHSFHHYPHQQDVVTEMRRVLRPSGRLLLIDGFRDNIVGWMTYDVVIRAVEKEVFHAPWSTIHQYFETAGFRDIRRRKFNYWFPALLTVGVA